MAIIATTSTWFLIGLISGMPVSEYFEGPQAHELCEGKIATSKDKGFVGKCVEIDLTPSNLPLYQSTPMPYYGNGQNLIIPYDNNRILVPDKGIRPQ